MQDLDSKIEAYLAGELNPEETAEYEKELQHNSELYESVQEQRELRERLEGFRVRQKVANALSENQRSSNWSLSGKSIFIALLMILTFCLWYFTRKQPQAVNTANPVIEKKEPVMPSSPKSQVEPVVEAPEKIEPKPKSTPSKSRLMALAKQFYQPPNTAITRSSGENNSASDIQRAKQAYEDEQYEDCLEILLTLGGSVQPSEVRYLLASTYFTLGNYKKAAEIYTSLESSFIYQYDAGWNLIMCQLAEGKLDKAKELLAALSEDPQAPYKARAQELLVRL